MTGSEFEDELKKMVTSYGASCEEAIQAADKIAECMRKIPDYELEYCIRMNPCLSRFQKWRLIRRIRRENK